MSGLPKPATFASPAPQAPTNRILAALSRAQFQRLSPYLEPVTLEVGQILYRKGELLPDVYFLESGMVSLVLYSQNAIAVTIAVVGRGGMVGTVAALSNDVTFSHAIVQVAGIGRRLPMSRIKAEMERKSKATDLLQDGMREIVEQAAQNALCYRLHTVEQRLSRWLLLISDVVESDSFSLTQGSLRHMVGARITGVSAAAAAMRMAGLIEYKRGRITLLNRKAIELAACPCYAALHDQFINST